MGKGEKKVNIPLCAALILLTLTLITTHMTCGLYARYTSSATGSDSARVARFKVECVVEENTKTTDETNDFIVTVKNNSEVAVEYTLDVDVHDALKVELNNPVPASVRANGVTFDGDWTLAPGEDREHYLTFSVDNWSKLTATVDGGIKKDFALNFDVHVHVQQID